MNGQNEIKIGEIELYHAQNEYTSSYCVVNFFKVFTLFELGCTLFEATNKEAFYSYFNSNWYAAGEERILIDRKLGFKIENSGESFTQFICRREYEFILKDFEIMMKNFDAL